MASSLQNTPKEVHEIERCKRLQQSFQQLFNDNPLFSPHATIAFETLEKLGEGGMGSVFRVKDHRMNRQAALKVLLNENPELKQRERFMREAHVTARLNHPTIPAVYEAGSTKDNQVFMLMKVIEGDTLGDRIQQYHDNDCPPSELRELLEILAKVTEAIAYAHSQSVLHRDLKPANIMVGHFGEVLVMDWGLAKEMDVVDIEQAHSEGMPDALQFEDNGLTLSGSIIGTPGYMSPEQASGEPVDGLTDIFALGIILTRILTGVAPIPGHSVMEKIVATVKGWISSPKDLKDDVPLELNSLAIVATQADKEKRIASAAQFQIELMSFLAGAELESHKYQKLELMKRRVSRNPRSLIGLLFATLILSVLTLSLGEYFVVQAASDLALVNQQDADAVVQSKKDIQEAQLEIANRKRTLAQKEAAIAAEMLALFDKAKEQSRRGGKEEELTELVDKALELGGRDYIVLMTAAEIYDRAGMKDKMPALLNEAVEKHEKPYSALFLLHVLENETADDFRLTKPYKKLVKIAKRHKETNEFTLYVDALTEYDSGKYQEALRLLSNIDEITKKFYPVNNLRCTIYKELQNYPEAINAAKKCLSIRPNSSMSKNNLAASYLEFGKFKKAETILVNLLKKNPTNTIALYNLGTVLLNQKRYTESLSTHMKAVKLAPSLGYPYQGVGEVYLAQNNFTKAISYFTKSLENNPDGTRALSYRAESFKASQQWERALIDYSRLVTFFNPGGKTLTSDWAKVYRERGVCYWKVKKYKLALRDLSFVINAFPKDMESFAYRARVYLEIGEWQKVIIDCTTALQFPDTSLAVLGYRGEAYLQLGMFTKALADFDYAAANSQDGSFKKAMTLVATKIRKRLKR